MTALAFHSLATLRARLAELNRLPMTPDVVRERAEVCREIAHHTATLGSR